MKVITVWNPWVKSTWERRGVEDSRVLGLHSTGGVGKWQGVLPQKRVVLPVDLCSQQQKKKPHVYTSPPFLPLQFAVEILIAFGAILHFSVLSTFPYRSCNTTTSKTPAEVRPLSKLYSPLYMPRRSPSSLVSLVSVLHTCLGRWRTKKKSFWCRGEGQAPKVEGRSNYPPSRRCEIWSTYIHQSIYREREKDIDVPYI